MALVHINLSYPQLSTLLQQEINKQEINVKGYDIKIENLLVGEKAKRLRVSGQIVSKWNANFDFSAIPIYLAAENKLDLQDINLTLDAKNLIFKGILKLAQGNIKSRIEKLIEQPLSEQLKVVQKTLDKELSKAPLPHNLNLHSKTESILIQKLEVLPDHLSVSAVINHEININFN